MPELPRRPRCDIAAQIQDTGGRSREVLIMPSHLISSQICSASLPPHLDFTQEPRVEADFEMVSFRPESVSA